MLAPKLPLLSTAEAGDWVAIVTVMFAGVFAARVRLDGLKLPDAFRGRLPQLKEPVPE